MSPLSREKALIFRITHIQNLEFVVSNGLHCRNSKVKDPNFVEIGNPDLIAKRARRPVPCAPGGTLGDYIPFYFTPYTPMLLNIKTGYHGMKQTPMKDIAILVTSLRTLKEKGIAFVFSDRHAYLEAAEFSNDLDDLNRIDWKMLNGRDFKRDPDNPGKFERYQAEALVHKSMPMDALLGIACFGEQQRERIEPILDAAAVKIDLKALPGWYV
jgi:hypothetical protein